MNWYFFFYQILIKWNCTICTQISGWKMYFTRYVHDFQKYQTNLVRNVYSFVYIIYEIRNVDGHWCMSKVLHISGQRCCDCRRQIVQLYEYFKTQSRGTQNVCIDRRRQRNLITDVLALSKYRPSNACSSFAVSNVIRTFAEVLQTGGYFQ